MRVHPRARKKGKPSHMPTVLYAEKVYPDDSVEREVYGPDTRILMRAANTLADLSDADCAEADGLMFLRHWITEHFEATGSPRAEWILENWSAMLPKFIKIFPHEYKRVLGIPRKVAQTIPLPSSIATIAANQQVIHG